MPKELTAYIPTTVNGRSDAARRSMSRIGGIARIYDYTNPEIPGWVKDLSLGVADSVILTKYHNFVKSYHSDGHILFLDQDIIVSSKATAMDFTYDEFVVFPVFRGHAYDIQFKDRLFGDATVSQLTQSGELPQVVHFSRSMFACSATIARLMFAEGNLKNAGHMLELPHLMMNFLRMNCIRPTLNRSVRGREVSLN